jgi:hypothetical protein
MPNLVGKTELYRTVLTQVVPMTTKGQLEIAEGVDVKKVNLKSKVHWIGGLKWLVSFFE